MPAVLVLDLAESLPLDGARDHDGRLAGRLARLLQGLVDLLHVVAIDDDGAATEGLDPVAIDIGLPFVLGRSPLAEPIDIEDGGEVREPVVAGFVEPFPDRPFRQLAIAGESPDVVGQLVELAAGECDPDRDGQPLAQRPGRHIDPGKNRRRMALEPRSKFPEGQQLIVADHPNRLEDGVEQGRGMALGEDQVVVGGRARIVPVVEEVPGDEDGHQIGGGHRGGGMAGAGGSARSNAVDA